MVRECAIALVVKPCAFSDPVCANELGRERLQSGNADQLGIEYNLALGEDLSRVRTLNMPRIR